MTQATNNLSHLTAQQQDDLCCLATGGGFSTRKLYSNNEESLITLKRPVILNGISNVITAQDCLDRAIVVECPPLSNESRKTEAELHQAFNQARPKLLGALCDLMAQVLKVLPSVHLSIHPRLADFACLGHALEHVMQWPDKTFQRTYQANQPHSATEALDACPVAVAVALIELIHTEHEFYGTYHQLYQRLLP